MSHEVALPVVFIFFYDRDGQRGVFKVVKNDNFLVFLAVWVLFSKFFGQVTEWLILELRENIRVLHVVASPMDFNLLRDLGQQLGFLKMLLF